MLTISHTGIEELTKAIEELETLTSKPTLTNRDEKRHSFLLAKVALLKQGISVTELRNFEQDRLLAEAGLRAPEKARTKLPDDVAEDWRNFVQHKEVRMTSRPSEREIRANESGTQSVTYTQEVSGGVFRPSGFAARSFETMKQYDSVFDAQFSNIIETDDGNVMPFPAWDDLENSSALVGETQQSNEVDVANFAQIQLNAYSFRSKIVAVSLELLQDSNFEWGFVLERIFSMRHARGVGQALMTGSGVNAPTGLVTAVLASGTSPVIAAGSASNTGNSDSAATTIGTQDIANLYAKLDPAYRRGAAFYMADATLEYLLALLDKYGHPIAKFREGLNGTDGDIPYIMGKPVAVCPSMPAMGSGKNSVLFGNPFYFVQRRVPSASYVRAFWQTPTLALNGLVGFESFMRVDSNLSAGNASYTPFVVLQQHS
ncbi:MAG: phage major capsid protein [Candidatus Acidiferrales bacterium]